MDMVSVQNNFVLKKTKLSNGHTNGNGLMTNGHGNGYIGNIEFGHSDFMKIQRYEDLIGLYLTEIGTIFYRIHYCRRNTSC